MPTTSEEFLLGFIPSRDGSDYSQDLETPSWAELVYSLNNEGVGGNQTIEIIFVGKDIYDSSASGSGIGGISGLTTKNDILRTSLEGAQGSAAILAATRATQDGANTGRYAAALLRNDQLASGHITGIVWRKI